MFLTADRKSICYTTGLARGRGHMFAGVAQLAEQLICNQQVAGSSPIASSGGRLGGMPEWLKGADCKSVGKRLRRFKSFSLHSALVQGWASEARTTVLPAHFGEQAVTSHRQRWCGSSSVGRASAFQAEGRGFEPRLPLCSSGEAGG